MKRSIKKFQQAFQLLFITLVVVVFGRLISHFLKRANCHSSLQSLYSTLIQQARITEMRRLVIFSDRSRSLIVVVVVSLSVIRHLHHNKILWCDTRHSTSLLLLSFIQFNLILNSPRSWCLVWCENPKKPFLSSISTYSGFFLQIIIIIIMNIFF